MIKKLENIGRVNIDVDSNLRTKTTEIEVWVKDAVESSGDVTVAVNVTMQEGAEIFNVLVQGNLYNIHSAGTCNSITLTNDKTGGIVIINPVQETIFAAYLHEGEQCAGSLCYNCGTAIKELQDDIAFLSDYAHFVFK